MPDRWQYGNSSIATVHIKLISQREYTVLSPGSPSVKLFMKPQTPTATGRAVTSSWRETVGYVTKERRTICQLTKFEGYWIRPVYIYIRRVAYVLYWFQYFYDRPDCFVSLFFTVRQRPQVDFLKEFLQSLNQRNGRGLSLWTSTPSIGIVTDLNPLRRQLITRSAPVSVSPSTSTFSLIVFLQTYPSTFQRWKTRRERQP